MMQTGRNEMIDGIAEEASDNDSDLEELQGDIAKFDESVREFLESHRGSQNFFRESRGTVRGRGARGPRKAAKPRGDITARLAKVNQAFLNREYDQALEIAFEIIRINAETHQAWVALSSIFRERGEPDRALSAMVYAAHLRPKDISGWLRSASFAMESIGDDETINLHTARLCYSAALRADRTNAQARVGKAEVCHRQGHLLAAIAEYVYILKDCPHNVQIIRKLAESCIDSKNTASAIPSAISAYRQYFDYLMVHTQTGVDLQASFWHDVGVYVELIASIGNYKEAIHELKRVSRWVLGRSPESFWSRWPDDDREWDVEDDRRLAVHPCVDDDERSSIGLLLPLELRIRLAIYRCKLGDQKEALNHLNLLDPAQSSTEVFTRDFPFLIYDMGTELIRVGRPELAKQYFRILHDLPDGPDALVFLQLGRCHLGVGEQEAAEDMFLAALDADEDNIDARVELANLYEKARENEEALILTAEALALREARERPFDDTPRSGVTQRASESRSARKIPRRSFQREREGPPSLISQFGRPVIPKRHRLKRLTAPDRRRRDEQARALKLSQQYENVQDLKRKISAGRGELIPKWMSCSKELIDDFRSLKRFYTWDKYLNFLGPSLGQDGSNEPPETELSQMYNRLNRSIGPQSEQYYAQADNPDSASHQGITFDNWLNLFLDYAIGLALVHRREDAYQVCAAAKDSTVFQSSKHNFEIHVAWSVCAIYTNDEERCIAVARHLMRDGGISDSYRMFALLSLLCQSPISWYTSGPAQKYILRQIKALDATHHMDTRPRETGIVGIDICLLMLYGHILFTSTSYSYALGYFLRARSLDPTNDMINLSLGLAYVHYGLKRQSTNRQYLILQGQAFLSQYAQRDSESSLEPEKLYNVGRLFQLLGISYLSSFYYEKALDLCKQLPKSHDLCCLISANAVISLLTVGNFATAHSVLKRNLRL